MQARRGTRSSGHKLRTWVLGTAIACSFTAAPIPTVQAIPPERAQQKRTAAKNAAKKGKLKLAAAWLVSLAFEVLCDPVSCDELQARVGAARPRRRSRLSDAEREAFRTSFVEPVPRAAVELFAVATELQWQAAAAEEEVLITIGRIASAREQGDDRQVQELEKRREFFVTASALAKLAATHVWRKLARAVSQLTYIAPSQDELDELARQVEQEGLPPALETELLRFSIVDDSDLSLLGAELATLETVDIPETFHDLVDLYAQLNADNEDIEQCTCVRHEQPDAGSQPDGGT